MQRGGSPRISFSLSQRSLAVVARQQPRCGPDVQVSPVGRQVEFAESIWQVPPVQIPEQHSAAALHDSLWSLQSWAAQTPPKQPREQQSCARVHAWPFARQASVQRVTPAWPVTGSQRPLQHDSCEVHASLGKPQAAFGVSTHAPFWQAPLQQSALPQHVPPLPWQVADAHLPPEQELEQHSPFPPQLASLATHPAAAPHVPLSQRLEQHCPAVVQAFPSAPHVPPSEPLIGALHAPFTQLPEAHCWLALQGAPAPPASGPAEVGPDPSEPSDPHATTPRSTAIGRRRSVFVEKEVR